MSDGVKEGLKILLSKNINCEIIISNADIPILNINIDLKLEIPEIENNDGNITFVYLKEAKIYQSEIIRELNNKIIQLMNRINENENSIYSLSLMNECIEKKRKNKEKELLSKIEEIENEKYKKEFDEMLLTLYENGETIKELENMSKNNSLLKKENKELKELLIKSKGELKELVDMTSKTEKKFSEEKKILEKKITEMEIKVSEMKKKDEKKNNLQLRSNRVHPEVQPNRIHDSKACTIT